MKYSRRAAEPEIVEELAAPAEGKGRPTPKRRESVGVRGPVTAPKTRKEAYARQRTQAKQAKAARQTATSSSSAATGTMTPAQRRTAMRTGEVLSRRDQGNTRKLARDFVDSRRMASNYFLLLFPIMILSSFVAPALQLVTLALVFGFVFEWFITGRKVRAMAAERFGQAEGSNMSIGFYAGSRAYLPRRWRLPAPQLSRGDQI